MEAEANENASATQKKTLVSHFESFKTFIKSFCKELRMSPWKSLIGPGELHENDFSLVHMWYIFILSFIPVCSLLTNVGLIRPYIGTDSGLCNWDVNRHKCESIIVFFITYRISFALSAFFLLTAILLTQVKKENAYGTSSLHTGFWIEKIIVVLVISCVAFAFPPSTFDRVWIYFVLFSDLTTSTLQMFLIRDASKYLHEKYFVIKKKNNTKHVQFFLILFCGMFLSTFIAIFFISFSIYEQIISPSSTQFSILATIITVTIILSFLVYTAVREKQEFFSSTQVASFCGLLLYKSSTYHVSKDESNVISTDFSKVVSVAMLYITIIYAFVRKDRVFYFFYFKWTICREHSLVDRRLKVPWNTNEKKQNKVNPNETLLDLDAGIDPKPLESIDLKQSQFLLIDVKEPGYHVSYNEALIHAVLFVVSLKSTGLVTNYFQLSGSTEKLHLEKTVAASAALLFSSIFVPLLYCWFLVFKHFTFESINPLSTNRLLEEFLKVFWHIIFITFVKTPLCFKKSTLSRYVYTIFFLTTFTLACVGLTPLFRRFLEKTTFFCDHVGALGACMSKDPAFIGLYRVFATAGIFFLILSVLLLRIKTVDNPRDSIHNGSWLLKFILLILIFVLLVNMPNKFSRVWLYTSLFATFAFAFVQLLCLLDIVDIINTSWTETTKWSPNTVYVSSTSLTTFMYAISTAAFVCFYVYFAHNYNCRVNRLFISINLVICISASIISIHPIIKSGGLLRSALVTSFCMYLTWSALNYNPNEKCNPLAHTIIMLEPKPTRDAVSIMDIFFLVITLIYFTTRVEIVSFNMEELFPKYLFHLKVFNTNNTEINNENLTAEQLQKRRQNNQFRPTNKEKTLKDRILFGENCCREYLHNDSKCEQVAVQTAYSYTCLHFVYYLATSYSFALLTHWLEPVPGSAFKINIHWAIMSVKMLGSSTCALLYVWTLIAPTLKSMYIKRQDN
ncbi:uncharacterized protein LOC105843211 [Hydra vulgaris]|uniref:Uncharacterized protein LOC105843211 n=1 Tax=Hydra vulgaris TaxID=6087 RepID=A0ABM4CFS2_HYDVU